MEAMDEDPEVHTILIVLILSLLLFLILGGLKLLGSLQLQLLHVFDEALFEDDGLQILQAPECLFGSQLLQLSCESLTCWPSCMV